MYILILTIYTLLYEYIDINNILENQNLGEKKKLIYTALTRASNSLKLLIENQV